MPLVFLSVVMKGDFWKQKNLWLTDLSLLSLIMIRSDHLFSLISWLSINLFRVIDVTVWRTAGSWYRRAKTWQVIRKKEWNSTCISSQGIRRCNRSAMDMRKEGNCFSGSAYVWASSLRWSPMMLVVAGEKKIRLMVRKWKYSWCCFSCRHNSLP